MCLKLHKWHSAALVSNYPYWAGLQPKTTCSSIHKAFCYISLASGLIWIADKSHTFISILNIFCYKAFRLIRFCVKCLELWMCDVNLVPNIGSKSIWRAGCSQVGLCTSVMGPVIVVPREQQVLSQSLFCTSRRGGNCSDQLETCLLLQSNLINLLSTPF